MTTKEDTVNLVIQRLDRLEKKMDDVSRILFEIAKTEERVVRLMEADNEKTRWLRTLQDRVVELEKHNSQADAISRRVERFFWILFTAGVGAAIAFWRTGP